MNLPASGQERMSASLGAGACCVLHTGLAELSPALGLRLRLRSACPAPFSLSRVPGSKPPPEGLPSPRSSVKKAGAVLSVSSLLSAPRMTTIQAPFAFLLGSFAHILSSGPQFSSLCVTQQSLGCLPGKESTIRCSKHTWSRCAPPNSDTPAPPDSSGAPVSGDGPSASWMPRAVESERWATECK